MMQDGEFRNIDHWKQALQDRLDQHALEHLHFKDIEE